MVPDLSSLKQERRGEQGEKLIADYRTPKIAFSPSIPTSFFNNRLIIGNRLFLTVLREPRGRELRQESNLIELVEC